VGWEWDRGGNTSISLFVNIFILKREEK
jgi:hypothetical protein